MIERRFPIALLAVVLLSLVCFSSAQGQWELGALLGAVACAGWVVTRGGERGLPRWVMGVILVALVVYSIMRVLEPGGSNVTPFTTFLATVVTLKMWEKRRVRDDAQMLGIAVFLNIGAILACAERRQADFTMGVMLIAVVPALVYATVLLQVRGGVERARGAGREALPPDVDEERRWMQSLRRLTLGLVAAGFAIATTLFVLVPRPEGTRGWGSLGPRMTVTAFRDRIDLGNAGLLSTSQAIALRVKYENDGSLAGLLGAQQQLYLRGAVLDRYDGGSWRSSMGVTTGAEAFEPQRGGRWRRDFPPMSKRSSTLSIRDYAAYGGTRPLFTPWRPQGVSFPDKARASEPGLPERVIRDPRTDAMVFERPEGEVRYEVEVARQALDGGVEGNVPRRAIEFPFPASIREFAVEQLRKAGVEPDPETRTWEEDARAVRTLEQSLRARCVYSREIRAAPADQDPTAWFIETEKRGHCEYFASALAALCRSVGINARVIAGYVASEVDDATKTYTVRQAGAHAWVEAEVAPGRWRVFDATPSEEMSRLLGEEQDFFASLDRWLVGLESAWLTGLVQFDDHLRKSIVGEEPPQEGRWRRSRTPAAQVRRAVVRHGNEIVWGAGIAVVLAMGVWVLKRRRSSAGGARWDGELGKLHRATLRALRAKGGPKPAWQGTLEYVDELGARSPGLAVQARPIVEMCYAAWFGGKEPTRDEVRGAWDALARVKAGGGGSVG